MPSSGDSALSKPSSLALGEGLDRLAVSSRVAIVLSFPPSSSLILRILRYSISFWSLRSCSYSSRWRRSSSYIRYSSISVSGLPRLVKYSTTVPKPKCCPRRSVSILSKTC